MIWLGDHEHRVLDAVLDDLLGEWHLADFAFEFCEVKTVHYVLGLLMDFTLDPLLQAEQMYPLAGSFALAR